MDRVDYQTEPSRYKHWKLKFDGPVATLLADFDENAGLRPGYKLKLNSYDLGVDIELNDAVNRIRFEHPEVRAVVIMSARERVFCSGANIFMLGVSSHAWKVNFCKFTNETRNGLEDSSKHEGLKFLAAVNGSCAGGGYELALACDEIILIDDRSSAVSLPEVPLLGVLPGTGGLTRLTDKRHVRHDLADVFCTTSEGVRGEKARRLAPRRRDRQARAIRGQGERARARARRRERPACIGEGRRADADRAHYRSRRARLSPCHGHDRPRRARRDFHDQRPERRSAAGRRGDRSSGRELVSARARPRARGRDPVDAHQRARHRRVADEDAKATSRRFSRWTRRSAALRDHWLVRETIGYLRRTLSRLDVTSRSLFALVDEGSCFAGTLLRSRARLRPDLPSRASGDKRAEDRAERGELRRLSDGERPEPARAALLRREAGAREAESEHRQAARRGRPPSRSASRPAFPTTSTGRTRCASRSRSAPR